MDIGVAAYLKKMNRSLILSKIIKHGKISRSDLANITKLTKATISTQVADIKNLVNARNLVGMIQADEFYHIQIQMLLSLM